MNLNKLKKLTGDASFRNFYRGKKNILVHCVKNKKSNLLEYDAINKILIKKNILAPRLISQNYKNNYIEIEDFGDLTVFKKFQKKSINKKLKEIFLGSVLSSPSFELKKGIINAPTKGSKTIDDSQ